MKMIDLKHSKIHLREDGIIEINCAEEHQFVRDDINEIIIACGNLTEGKKFPFLTVPGKYSNASKEALELIFSKNDTFNSSHDAYITKSLAQRLLGNFYIRVKKPKVPTKLFTDKKAALNWLKKQSEVK